MTLLAESFPNLHPDIPTDVREFLAEAERRIDRFQIDHVIPGFVAGDFALIYQQLRALAEQRFPAGTRFCEWGSGFGVVACLASMLGFNAYGIEIEEELIHEAEELAKFAQLDLPFLHGSFIPPGESLRLPTSRELTWTVRVTGDVLADVGLSPDDFELVYVYPWPGEEVAVRELFDRIAGQGAWLMTHHGERGSQLWRKTTSHKRGRR